MSGLKFKSLLLLRFAWLSKTLESRPESVLVLNLCIVCFQIQSTLAETTEQMSDRFDTTIKRVITPIVCLRFGHESRASCQGNFEISKYSISIESYSWINRRLLFVDVVAVAAVVTLKKRKTVVEERFEARPWSLFETLFQLVLHNKHHHCYFHVKNTSMISFIYFVFEKKEKIKRSAKRERKQNHKFQRTCGFGSALTFRQLWERTPNSR